MTGSKTAIYTAFAANIAIAIIKFIAASITGSSAMISEGIHSLVDTSNEVLLLVGLRKSKKVADETRPFGYGKELYFWSFVVSLMFFVLGGGVSMYEGIQHLLHPEKIRNPAWNYIVLAIAFLFDGYSLFTAIRVFNKQRGNTSFWKAVKASKDPATFVVLFEDLADVIGILIATVGIFLSHSLQNPYIDGISSILIGLLLMTVAIFLVRESRSLLMGETAPPEELDKVSAILMQNVNVAEVAARLSMYQGPEEVILVLQIKFQPNIQAQDLAIVNKNLKYTVQNSFPQFKHIYIEPV